MAIFNPQEHMKRVQNKDYLEVKWRLVWFNEATRENNRAGIYTVELEHDRQSGYARYWAIVWDGADDHWRTIKAYGHEIQVCGRIGVGIGSETRADFADFTEKAETKAKGRALADLGYGTQFAPELDEGERMADSPVQRKSVPAPERPMRVVQQAPAQEGSEMASANQKRAIGTLCDQLGRERPAMGDLTFMQAASILAELNKVMFERNRQNRKKAEQSLPPGA